MIYPRDLQLGSLLSSYMLHGGYATTLHTDALTFAHVLRRALDDVTHTNVIQKASHLLDSIFLLALRPNTILSPSDLRLYTRIFVSSRLPPVISLWNATQGHSFDTTNQPYDVVTSDTVSANETYMYFTNASGFVERDYVASPTDVLKMIIFRRTPEVRTFTNAEAQRLNKVVFTGLAPERFTECNGFPLKYYTQSEIDPESRSLLSGNFIVRAR